MPFRGDILDETTFPAEVLATFGEPGRAWVKVMVPVCYR